MVITLPTGGQPIKEWYRANLHGDGVMPGVALASRRTPLKKPRCGTCGRVSDGHTLLRIGQVRLVEGKKEAMMAIPKRHMCTSLWKTLPPQNT